MDYEKQGIFTDFWLLPQILCWHVQIVFNMQQSSTIAIIAAYVTVPLSKPILKLQVKSISIWQD